MIATFFFLAAAGFTIYDFLSVNSPKEDIQTYYSRTYPEIDLIKGNHAPILLFTDKLSRGISWDKLKNCVHISAYLVGIKFDNETNHINSHVVEIDVVQCKDLKGDERNSYFISDDATLIKSYANDNALCLRPNKSELIVKGKISGGEDYASLYINIGPCILTSGCINDTNEINQQQFR